MLKKLLRSNEAVLLSILLVLCVVLSIATPYFLTADNLFTVAGQLVELGLLTLGMAISIIAGGFDLSLTAMGSFGTVLLATFIGKLGWSIYPAMGLVLLIMLAFGALNGFLCGVLKLEAMLATLGTQGLLSGLALGVAKSEVHLIPNPEFFFGKFKLWGVIPFQFIIYIAAIIFCVILMHYTRWGRNAYMLGSNKAAARFTGINVTKTTFCVYILSAFMAFLAAVVVSSRLECGKSNVLDPLALQTVTASMFGGISIKGGHGNIIGCVLGVITFSVISNGLNLVGLSQFIKQIIVGAVLLGVLALSVWRERTA